MTSESNEKLRATRAVASRRRTRCVLIAASAATLCALLASAADAVPSLPYMLRIRPTAIVATMFGSVGASSVVGGAVGHGGDPTTAGTKLSIDREDVGLVGNAIEERSDPPRGEKRPEEESLASLRYLDIIRSLPPPVPHDVHPVATAYEESTVVQRAPWFDQPPVEECAASCCASSVAISLAQDDLRPINTLDGDDLADVRIRAFQDLKPTERYVMRGFRKAVVNLTHHAVDLTPEMAPCLMSGTIIHIDMFNPVLERFFIDIRPKMTQPYVLITSGTDNPSPPEKAYLRVLNEDPLLLRWYGTNAHNSALGHEKFVPMPLGLSRDYVAQQVELAALQIARRGRNPFAGSAKARWTDSPELFGDDVVDTSRSLFVNFGMSKSKKTTHRAGPFRMACDGRTDSQPPKEQVSCVNGTFPLRAVYAAASNYLFALSPPGRGTDCYRTYELLLLGVIPIVWHHPMYDAQPGGLLKGLPFLQLNGLNYTQSDLLKLMRDYVRGEDFAKTDFEGWERMLLRYWRRRVLKDAGRTGEIMTDEVEREYYRAYSYKSSVSASPQ